MVVAVGVTLMLELVAPVLQLYVLPPEPVKVLLPEPEHIVETDALAVIVGLLDTVTVTAAVFVHPLLFVPVTV